MNKNIRNMSNLAFKFFILILILIVVGCNKNEKREKGFIVFDNPRLWYFVPTNSVDKNSCAGDFRTDNLKRGTMFPAFQSKFLLENLDTVKAEIVEGDFSQRTFNLKIIPVEIEYSFKGGLINEGPTSKFKIKLNESYVEFDYDILPIQIKNVNPLFCYKRKKTDTEICECKKRNDDPNDYLLKICNFLKTKGDLSSQPCKYSIKKITTSNLDGKEVNKVDLDCCYLGDVAYFDLETKELISFSFGPK